MKTGRIARFAVFALAGILSLGTIWAAEGGAGGRGQGRGQGQAPGQGQRGPQMREQRMAQMTKELNLNAEQKKKIEALWAKQTEKMREWRQDTSLTREQRQEKMQAYRKEMATEMKKILNAEQFAKWDKMEKQRQVRRGQGRGPGGGQGQGGPRGQGNLPQN